MIWAYPGYDYNAEGKVVPIGNYDRAGVSTFLDQMLRWLTTNAARYRLEKWFLYTVYGLPEPYTTTYGGISLLAGPGTGAPLTPLGQLYRQYATP